MNKNKYFGKEKKECEIDEDSEFLNSTIANHGLLVRTYFCLKKAEIYQISSLVTYSENDLLNTGFFSLNSVKEIQYMLATHELRLGMTEKEVEEWVKIHTKKTPNLQSENLEETVEKIKQENETLRKELTEIKAYLKSWEESLKENEKEECVCPEENEEIKAEIKKEKIIKKQ